MALVLPPAGRDANGIPMAFHVALGDVHGGGESGRGTGQARRRTDGGISHRVMWVLGGRTAAAHGRGPAGQPGVFIESDLDSGAAAQRCASATPVHHLTKMVDAAFGHGLSPILSRCVRSRSVPRSAQSSVPLSIWCSTRRATRCLVQAPSAGTHTSLAATSTICRSLRGLPATQSPGGCFSCSPSGSALPSALSLARQPCSPGSASTAEHDHTTSGGPAVVPISGYMSGRARVRKAHCS